MKKVVSLVITVSGTVSRVPQFLCTIPSQQQITLGRVEPLPDLVAVCRRETGRNRCSIVPEAIHTAFPEKRRNHSTRHGNHVTPPIMTISVMEHSYQRLKNYHMIMRS